MAGTSGESQTEQAWLAEVSVEIEEAHRMLDGCVWHVPRADRWGRLSLAERVGVLIDMVAEGGPSGVAGGGGR